METPPLYSFGIPWPELNDGLDYSDLVRSADSGKTLIGFYSSRYPNSAPPRGWLRRIRNGQVAVDGEAATDPDAVLALGCRVVYRRVPWREPDAPWTLQVLYEDEHMIAVNKPSGLQVLPGGLFQQRTVLSQLQWRAWKPQPPSPVHRLGRGTSGVLLCAKTRSAKTTLSSYFAKGTLAAGGEGRSIRKVYRALVVGLVLEDEIVVDQPIGMVHYPGVANGLYVASPDGKPASSDVRVLERDAEAKRTLVQVEIHSGRPHQIRIHMAFVGHPLFGDPLYSVGGCPEFSEESVLIDDGFAEDGGYQKPMRPVPGDCGYHLHAHRLVLCHPSTKETVEITAPLPAILQTRTELDH